MNLSIVSYMDESATWHIRELQQTLSDLTGSKASLLSWEPHLTVGDGVTVDDDQFQKLVNEVKTSAVALPAFSLQLSGFSSIDNRPIGKNEVSTPYVLYIDVIVSQQLLDVVSAVEKITRSGEKWYHMPSPYLPHVTLAFRDLTAEGYQKGLAYLDGRSVDITTTIDHIALVEKLPDIDVERTRLSLS